MKKAAFIGDGHQIARVYHGETMASLRKELDFIADGTCLVKSDFDAVKEELAVPEASVVISRRPCVLLKYVKTAPALHVTDKCKGCKSCMRLGCPSISMKNGRASIDATLCVGCKVCEQLCAFGAIE